MSHLITYDRCPVCGSGKIEPLLEAKDFTVSKEEFPVWLCRDCGGAFTQQVPDAGSIGRYYQSQAYVSHSDTRKGLVNQLYHIVRNFTIKSKRRLVQRLNHSQPGRILDVGAGTGAFVSTMKAAGWEVTGLEPDPTARENARRHQGLTLLPLDTLFETQDQQFDIITLWHVLEHVHALHEYISTFHRILKDGGWLVIAVPNYRSHDAGVYGSHWAAYDVPRHLYHFSVQSMQALLEQHDFVIERLKPMWFDSFYVSMLSEQYRTGHNNIASGMWNAMISNIRAVGHPGRCSSIIYIIRKR